MMNNKRILYTFGFVGIFLLSWILIKQYQWQGHQKRHELALYQKQDSLRQSIERATQLQSMNAMLEKIDQELTQNQDRSISEATINRLAIFSQSLASEGYNYLKPTLQYNFGRGQLLLNLIQMEIDSISFARIKENCTFAGAELSEADLSDQNLSGIDLHGANLKNAKLVQADLSYANLKGAKLWGSNLSQAKLEEASMHRIDLQWANLDGAKLPGAVMQGAKLNNARLRETDMSCVILYYAEIKDAFFQGANLERCNMFGSDISRSNFEHANMNLFDVRMGVADEAVFEGANMWECKLREVSVEDDDFLDKLEAWEVIGAGDVKSRYQLINDPTKRSKYQLRIAPK